MAYRPKIKANATGTLTDLPLDAETLSGASKETTLTDSDSKIATSKAVKSFVEGKGYLTSYVDTGATSVETTGSGNAVTNASYNPTTRKLTLTKGTTFLTSHQDISGKENTSNKVTSITSSSTNTEYPSAAAVYSAIQNVIEVSAGKTKNYVVKCTNVSSDYINSSLNSTQQTITIDGISSKSIQILTNGAGATTGKTITELNLQIGDIFSIIETDVPDRWVGGITSTTLTLYPLETKLNMDLTPTQNSTNPITSGAAYDISKQVAPLNYGVCSTSASTTAKTVTLNGNISELVAGLRILVKFNNANTATMSNVTLNVNSLGAKNISGHNNNIGVLTGIVEFVYDGTYWVIVNAQYSGTASNANKFFFNFYTTYSANEIVFYSGSFYKCKSNNTKSVLPTNTSYWTEVTSQYLEKNSSEGTFLASEYEKTINLFNKNAIFANYGVKASDGTFNYDTSLIRTDYIEIESSTTYKHNGLPNFSSNVGLAFYDSSKTYISGYNASNSNYNQFTTPSNAKYLILCVDVADSGYITNLNTLMLVKGTTLPSSYIAYGGGAIAHKGDIEPVLLWENGNPYTSYGANSPTIVNSSSFKYLIIGAMINSSTVQAVQYFKIQNRIGRTAYLSLTDNTTNNLYHRGLEITSNTQISFQNGYLNSSPNPSCCIPCVIYGSNI